MISNISPVRHSCNTLHAWRVRGGAALLVKIHLDTLQQILRLWLPPIQRSDPIRAGGSRESGSPSRSCCDCTGRNPESTFRLGREASCQDEFRNRRCRCVLRKAPAARRSASLSSRGKIPFWQNICPLQSEQVSSRVRLRSLALCYKR